MLSIFNEISVFQADLIKSFAVFYLLLIGNYIASSLFACYEVNYIKTHKWFQLLMAFLLFYFLVTLVSDTGNLELTPPIERLINSLFYFIGFLFVMRLDVTITLIVLSLIFTVYFIELNKDFYLEKGKKLDDPADKSVYNDNRYWITMNWPIRLRLFPVVDKDFETINRIQTVLYYIIVFLLVIGVISYGGEIHDTVSKSKHLTWIDVITDTSICKLKTRKSFWHYIKVGLGMKL